MKAGQSMSLTTQPWPTQESRARRRMRGRSYCWRLRVRFTSSSSFLEVVHGSKYDRRWGEGDGEKGGGDENCRRVEGAWLWVRRGEAGNMGGAGRDGKA
jgi:hypothetical protein